MHWKCAPCILSWIKHQSEQRVLKQNAEIQAESGRSALGLNCMNYAKTWCSKLNTSFPVCKFKLCRCFFFFLSPYYKKSKQCTSTTVLEKHFFDRIRALLAGLLNITLKMWWLICVFVQFCSQPAGRARRTSMKALSGVSVQLIHRNSCLCCTRVGEWRYICRFIRKCPQYNPFASLPHHALNSPVYGEGKKINSHIKARLHLDLLKEQIP